MSVPRNKNHSEGHGQNTLDLTDKFWDKIRQGTQQFQEARVNQETPLLDYAPLTWYYGLPQSHPYRLWADEHAPTSVIDEDCANIRTLPLREQWIAFWQTMERLEVDRLAFFELFYVNRPGEDPAWDRFRPFLEGSDLVPVVWLWVVRGRLDWIRAQHEPAFSDGGLHVLPVNAELEDYAVKEFDWAASCIHFDIPKEDGFDEQALDPALRGDDPRPDPAQENSQPSPRAETNEIHVEPELFVDEEDVAMQQDDVQLGEGPTFPPARENPGLKHITVAPDGKTATVHWNNLDIKTKGTKRIYNKDPDVKVNLAADGKALREGRGLDKRKLPAEINQVVDWLYHDCPRYTGSPMKTKLHDAYPNHFNQLGNIAFDSPMKSFTAAEMGMSEGMFTLLTNNATHVMASAKNISQARSNGLVRLQRPRFANQSRATYDDVRLKGMAKRGVFGSTEKKGGSEANQNPNDIYGNNSEDAMIGMLWAIARRDITAKDLGMKRLGTEYKSLHAAAVEAVNRCREVETYLEEERASHAEVLDWHRKQAQMRLDGEKLGVERDQKWREAWKATNLPIPDGLEDELTCNKALPRYKPFAKDRRTKCSRNEHKNLCLQNRPTPTIPVEKSKDFPVPERYASSSKKSENDQLFKQPKRKTKDLPARNPPKAVVVEGGVQETTSPKKKSRSRKKIGPQSVVVIDEDAAVD